LSVTLKNISNFIDINELNVNVSLCLTNYHAMKTYTVVNEEPHDEMYEGVEI